MCSQLQVTIKQHVGCKSTTKESTNSIYLYGVTVDTELCIVPLATKNIVFVNIFLQ